MTISRNRNNGRVTNYWCVSQHFWRLLKITSPKQWMVSCKVYSFDLYVRILAGSLEIKKSYFGEITPIFIENNVSECCFCHFDLEFLEMISWIQVKEMSLEWFKDCFLKKNPPFLFQNMGSKKTLSQLRGFLVGCKKKGALYVQSDGTELNLLQICRSARHCGTASEGFKLTAAENMQISQGFFFKTASSKFLYQCVTSADYGW